MEYARKGTLGGYKPVSEAEDFTHILLTVEEYQKLQQRLQRAKDDAAAAHRDADQRERRAKNDAAAQIQNAKDACNTELEQLRAMLEHEQEERAYQERLNKALLRAATERANADRDIRPKKERSGYLIISSREIDQTYKDGRATKKAIIWETAIQTPFSVDLTEDLAKEQAVRYLFGKGSSDETAWPINAIGIDGFFGKGYQAMIKEDFAEVAKAKVEQREPDLWCRYNPVLSMKIRANVKAGYWELLLVHLKPLTAFPQDMRP